MTATERKSDFNLMSKLWGVYYDDFKETLSRYNGTALYVF